MMYGIPAYKLEKDVIESEIDALRELGVEFKTGVEVGKDITIEQLKKQGYKAFYIAIGCQGGRRPGIENDTAKGTDIAVSYLKEALDKKENAKLCFQREITPIIIKETTELGERIELVLPVRLNE